jgi:uncharacterized membrane protein YdbT with pleckstrin-like domain
MSQSEVLGVIRHALTAGAGALAADGVITNGQAQMWVGLAMLLVGVIWSVAQKRGIVK